MLLFLETLIRSEYHRLHRAISSSFATTTTPLSSAAADCITMQFFIVGTVSGLSLPVQEQQNKAVEWRLIVIPYLRIKLGA